MNRDQAIRRILWQILFLNILVAGSKLLYGRATENISMWADGLHSSFDGGSNIVALLGIWAASLPPDKEHPYGHRKYEAFASFVISVFLFLACFHVVKNSYLRFIEPSTPTVTYLSFVIMMVTIGINYGVMRWENRRGRELKSGLLIADSLHTRSDLFSSLSVLASLAATASGYPMLDPVAAVIIAGFIGKTGFEILLEASSVLSDSSRIDPLRIREIAMRIPGVQDCHDVRTRGSMNHIYVDFHVDVPFDMTAEAAHKTAHEIESLIKNELDEVADVVIHVEPHGKDRCG